jgi:uncharacterized membrane protein HdeD (DUF308 family)
MLESLYRFAGDRDPVVVVLAAISMVIAGGMVIVHPPLVAWVIGLGLILGGIAVLVASFSNRNGRLG